MKRNSKLGGAVAQFHWDEKRLMRTRPIRCPAGMDLDGSLLYVASMQDNVVHAIGLDRLSLLGEITNPNFNDIHSLHRTRNGLLVASTGLDLVLEVGLGGKSLWEWWAIDNGFDRDPLNRKRQLQRGVDHREIDYPTLSQTTHVNSAIYTDSEERGVLVSLFHQGKVILVDRHTSRWDVVLEGLKNPHSICLLGGGRYLLSDTNGKRILIFELDKGIVRVIHGDFDWIQDAIRTTRGAYLIADSNNHRIVEVDEKGTVLGEIRYPNEWKIFQIKEMPD